VRAYIDAARRNGDPRFLGFAQATLATFGAGAALPLELRVLRATILQSLHDFSAALDELNAVLAVNLNHAQALLTRATILQVRGRFPEAQRDCTRLWRVAGELTSELCLASVAALTGRQESALQLAQRALHNAPADDATTRLWALTLIAEIATRSGRPELAIRNFQAGLADVPGDRYLRASYCDFLLDQGQAEAVLALSADLQRDDNLLLRRVLALQSLAASVPSGGRHNSYASQLRAELAVLRDRHAEAQLRGDRTHLREAARMTLHLLRDPATALTLARENWNAQKEPADARILLEAALATRDTAARAQITAWVQSTGLEDARLSALAN
jgi:tetratricopeptide (TPR) repeat protein